MRAPLDRGGHELDLDSISTLLSEILSHCHPRQIWLFGRRARGDATPASDWDLLVVVPDATNDSLSILASRGVFLCGESDFVEDRDTVNTLLYEIAKDAVLI